MLGCIQPMSSPMMNRTLGFACGEPGACGCDCAKLDKLAAAVAMPKLTRPSESFLSSTELAGMGSLLCYHDPAQDRPPAAGHRSDHACPGGAKARSKLGLVVSFSLVCGRGNLAQAAAR